MEALLNALLNGLVLAVPTMIGLAVAIIFTANRQKNARIEAQEIVNKQFAEQATEINRLWTRIEKTENEKTAAEARHKIDLQTIATQYQTDKDALNERITENGESLKRVEMALEKAEVLITEISSERDSAKLELENTKRELSNTRAALEGRLREVQTTLDKLNKDYADMSKLYSDLQEERKRVEKAFQERVTKLEGDLHSAEARLADLESKLRETEAERDGLRQKNADLEKRVSELEAERNDLQNQVNGLRAELVELRSSGPNKPDNPTDTVLPINED